MARAWIRNPTERGANRPAERPPQAGAESDFNEIALAAIALEENFVVAFRESRGTVDPELKLGF